MVLKLHQVILQVFWAIIHQAQLIWVQLASLCPFQPVLSLS